MKALKEFLQIEFSIIQGGMARITTGAFAACCSNAGILGTIASGGLNPDELAFEIKEFRKKSERPFAVNIPANHVYLDKILETIIALNVKIVIVGNGNTVKLIETLKTANMIVFPVLGSPEFASFYERAGADAIIAEGVESGGHIGRMTTMTLIPQVCDNVKIPVIAAGGIADNRQYKAALMLGACGVQIGTALLVSKECPVHDNYKNMILKAKGASTTVIGTILKDRVRVINNSLAKQYFLLEEKQDIVSIKTLLKRSYNNAVNNGDVKNGSVMAGEVASQMKKIRPLQDIIRSICIG